MTQPHIVLNWAAIAVATVAAFLIGWIWYGPLFGKPWAKAMGIKMDKKPDPAVMMKAMGLQLLGLFLTTFVLAHTSQVWRASVWGISGQDGSSMMYGCYAALFTWIGFYVPLQLGKISWEMKPWKLFFINAGHDLVTLWVIAQILTHWR